MSLMPSLALLLELADSVAGKRDPANVSLRYAQQAAASCDYLESHARRVYSCIISPQLRAARVLADKIKQKKVGADGLFSCRDVYLNGWACLESPEAVKRAPEVLEDAGWVRGLTTVPGPRGGRPADRYEVNPAVHHEQ